MGIWANFSIGKPKYLGFFIMWLLEQVTGILSIGHIGPRLI